MQGWFGFELRIFTCRAFRVWSPHCGLQKSCSKRIQSLWKKSELKRLAIKCIANKFLASKGDLTKSAYKMRRNQWWWPKKAGRPKGTYVVRHALAAQTDQLFIQKLQMMFFHQIRCRFVVKEITFFEFNDDDRRWHREMDTFHCPPTNERNNLAGIVPKLRLTVRL